MTVNKAINTFFTLDLSSIVGTFAFMTDVYYRSHLMAFGQYTAENLTIDLLFSAGFL